MKNSKKAATEMKYMACGRPEMNDSHRRYIMSRARTRKNINFKSITEAVNKHFNTNFSVFQIAGYLGNQGIRQN